MSDDQLPVLPSKPHTIAKTTILGKYLEKWFRILGQSEWCRNRDLYYLDGLAGPGKHEGGEPGSPLVALEAAHGAISTLGSAWLPRSVICIFVEKDRSNFEALTQRQARFVDSAEIDTQKITTSLVRGDIEKILPKLQNDFPKAFDGSSPLFSFLDPYGPTDLPFTVVSNLVSRPRAEALIHFDHDGLTRILRDYAAPTSAPHVTRALGTREWETTINASTPFHVASETFLEIYKTQIRKGAEHAFAFRMSTPMRKVSNVGYYLVFASSHKLGLEKMKETMKSVGQNGKYEFANARSGQLQLFVFSDPEPAARALYEEIRGRANVPLHEIEIFVLNETEHVGPTKPLKFLEQRGLLEVNASSPTRRRNTYPPDKIASISFSGEENPW